LALESRQFPSASSRFPRRFSTSGPSNAEIQEQILELKSICEGLATRIDGLAKTVEHKSHKNLIELDAAQHAGVVCRQTFRPTLDMVAIQVNHTCQLDCDTLTGLAIQGDIFARRERLLREIMLVDKCTWDDAHERLIEMDIYCEEFYWFYTMPYRVGFSLAFLGGVASCLLVFSKTVALPYARNVAGEDLPEGVEDISQMTYNQVGTWTWAWMEPMIGTASFLLLCMQFGRAQSVRLHLATYTEAMLGWRSGRVAAKFPQYDGAIVRAWARTMPVVGMDFMPRYRRAMLTAENRRKNFRGRSDYANQL
jgi:hypothetical protein